MNILSSFGDAGGSNCVSMKKMIKNWISNAFTSATKAIKCGAEAQFTPRASPCTRQASGGSHG